MPPSDRIVPPWGAVTCRSSGGGAPGQTRATQLNGAPAGTSSDDLFDFDQAFLRQVRKERIDLALELIARYLKFALELI